MLGIWARTITPHIGPIRVNIVASSIPDLEYLPFPLYGIEHGERIPRVARVVVSTANRQQLHHNRQYKESSNASSIILENSKYKAMYSQHRTCDRSVSGIG